MELSSLFDGELNPVAPKAQRKVPIPEGLDLDEWINEPPSDPEDNDDLGEPASNYNANSNQMFLKRPDSFTSVSSTANYGGSNNNNHGDAYVSSGTNNLGAKKLVPELSEDDLAKYRETRKMQIESNPFYIKQSVKKSESNNLLANSSNSNNYNNQQFHLNGSNPSISELRSQSIDLKIPIIIPGVTSSDSYYRMSQIDLENKKLKKKMKNKLASKSNKGGKKSGKNGHIEKDDEDDEEDDMPVVKVLTNEMPEGANNDSDDDGKPKRSLNDPHRALDINLDE